MKLEFQIEELEDLEVQEQNKIIYKFEKETLKVSFFYLLNNYFS